MENFLGALIRDFRVAARALWKEPRFSIIAVIAFSLGIGSVTVIFSTIESILLKPFPYKNADRLTTIYEHFASGAVDRRLFSAEEFVDFKEQNHSFEDVIGVSPMDVLFRNSEGTQQVLGSWVTSNTFEFLGLKPLLGRPIMPSDGEAEAAPVFAMSYKLWIDKFDKDPNIVGRSFDLNGKSTLLVAIMPPRFRLYDLEIWIPLKVSRDTDVVGAYNRSAHFRALGRLKSGLALSSVAADLNVILQGYKARHPADYPEPVTIIARTLADTVVGDFKRTLFVLMAAVSMLLLIACGNVAHLLLARATARDKEMALRQSLGASQMRIVGQLLMESLSLALTGCFVGCFLAWIGLKAIQIIIPPDTIPSEVVIALNPYALLMALAATCVATLLCGFVPAIRANETQLSARLASSAKGVSIGFRHGNFRAGLIIAEVGLSIVLLIGSGLMIKSVFALKHLNPGFDPTKVLMIQLPLPAKYDSVDHKRLFFERVFEHVQAIPGVISVANTFSVPPCCAAPSLLAIAGKPHSEPIYIKYEPCSASYFKTLGIELEVGRLFSEDEVASGRQLAVVNRAFVLTYFSSQLPIGEKIKFSSFDTVPDYPHNAYFDIIGVVADVKNEGLQEPATPEAYIPYTSFGPTHRTLLIKTAVEPLTLLPAVRKEIWAAEPGAALTDTMTLENYLAENFYVQPQFSLITISAFAALGLTLALIGVFGIMAYSVMLQMPEIGIRIALGARRGTILGMIMSKGLRLICVGIIFGTLVSIGLMRFVSSQFWGVSSGDPWTFAMVAALMLVTGTVACLQPAWKATQVDPLTVIRSE
jgi:putative ABC transport system permease protein